MKPQKITAKERHTEGDVAIIDPMNGQFVKLFPEKSLRLHVADISGAWREELVVLTQDEIHIYFNQAPLFLNEKSNRLCDQPHYRRSKMTYNYYSH